MNNNFIRSLRFASLLAVTGLHVACVADGIDGNEIPTWEEYLTEATRTFDGKEFYVIEWDKAVTLDELRQSYEELYGAATDGIDSPGLRSQSLVNDNNGAVDIWNLTDRFNLTYCVSNEFGANHGRMVAEMQRATRAWESAANINFIYLPGHNGSCNNSNPNVRFSVRPWNNSGACAFNPYESGGASGCVPRTLVININDLDTNPFYDANAPNTTTEGVLRHELGHIIGLRHEHAQLAAYAEPDWKRVTDYDQASVMHYPWKGGILTSDLSLTATDRRGVEALYGAPSPEPALHNGMRVRLRHARTGQCAKSIGGNGGTLSSVACGTDANLVFVLESVQGGGYRLRHEATSQCIYTHNTNGSAVKHWGCWNDPGMRFDIIPFLGGYRLRNHSTGQSLYANNGGTYNWGDWEDLNMIYFLDPLAWTPWLDRDNPGGAGDYEDRVSFPAGTVCANPTAIKCQALDGVSYTATEEVVNSNPTTGCWCVNSSQPDGACEDYRVQFYCP